MSLIDHHIYEFKKNVRNLFLHTVPASQEKVTVAKLEREGIRYLVSRLNDKVSNIFFGDPAFVEVVESFGQRRMNELTVEEDFILGILLGYGKKQQCERFLSRKRKKVEHPKTSVMPTNTWRLSHEREMQMQR